ncbi:protein of unknown function (DUF4219) [Popillia japonica]|uniref:CCHC-type domain-containing protein n=1 Tax=Popillia japonica TaxID=7064 RepID=A0AAW1HVI3_POPJA
MATNMLSIEKLDGRKNYAVWKTQMKFYLIHEELWDFVQKAPGEGEAATTDQKRDTKTFSKIGLLVQPQCLVHLQNAKTTNAAWDVLVKAFEDKGINRRCVVLGKLFDIKLKNHNSMESHVTSISRTSQELAAVGKPLDDDCNTSASGLTSELHNNKTENSCVEITTDYITTKLLQEEYNRRGKQGDGENALVSQHREKDKSRRGKQGNQLNKIQGPCYICNRKGHTAADCFRNPNRLNFHKTVDNQMKNQDISL